jgi:dCMP deaminase
MPVLSHYQALDLAEEVSQKSSCIRRKVGAVLVQGHEVIATGYNITPADEPTCIEGGCPRGQLTYLQVPGLQGYGGAGTCIAVHAEVSCMVDGMIGEVEYNPTLATMYVNHQCCPDCFKFLAEQRVQRVVCRHQLLIDDRWHQSSVCHYLLGKSGYVAS